MINPKKSNAEYTQSVINIIAFQQSSSSSTSGEIMLPIKALFLTPDGVLLTGGTPLKRKKKRKKDRQKKSATNGKFSERYNRSTPIEWI